MEPPRRARAAISARALIMTVAVAIFGAPVSASGLSVANSSLLTPIPGGTVPCVCQFANCTFGSETASSDPDTLWDIAELACAGTFPAQPHPHGYESVLAPMVILGVGALIRQLLQVSASGLPYTVTLLLFGACLGFCLQYLYLRPLQQAARLVSPTCSPNWFWKRTPA